MCPTSTMSYSIELNNDDITKQCILLNSKIHYQIALSGRLINRMKANGNQIGKQKTPKRLSSQNKMY